MSLRDLPIHEQRGPVIPPPEPLPATLDEAIQKFKGYPIDPTTRAQVSARVREWFTVQGQDVPEFALVTDGPILTVVIAPELPMDAAEFEHRTGRAPEHGDLDRVNCDVTGEIGHWNCGWCVEHDGPQAACMCAVRAWVGSPAGR